MGCICPGEDPQRDTVVEAKSNSRSTKKTKSRSPYSMTDYKQDYEENKLNPDDYINQITVYVVQGRNLPKYDVGPSAKSDPYVKVQFGGDEKKDSKVYRTTTIRRELNPIWNNQFTQEAQGLFNKVSFIKFDVFDHDRVSADDFMGTCAINTDTNPNAHYSTPIQWIPLVDKNNKPVVGKNGKRAAIQIKIKYTLNADDVNIRYYTHVMEFTVKKGKNIRNKEWIGRSDPYVKLEWGAQSYETSVINNNTSNPEWNETAFLFVHSSFQSKYQLKLCVMDSDINADDQLGTGYISASEVFSGCGIDGKKELNLDVKLKSVPVSSDKGLLDFKENDSFKAWGDLEVSIKLKPKDIIDVEFYNALVQTFDKNNDGVIDKNEVTEMFAELKIPDDPETFMNKFDENNDMKIDDDEVVKMLSDSDFQGSELATQLMAIYLRGDLKGDYQKHLMSGFTHKHTSTSKIINIKDRETGLLIQEFIPQYVWYALKLVYDIRLNRTIVQSRIANRILFQMSKKRGKAMDAPQSAQEIPGFIKQHNLDTKVLYKPVKDFKTFNDFFARGMNVNVYRPLSNENDENVIVSPADSRMMLWDSILDSTKFWIKGSKFTLENLLTNKTKVNIDKYKGGSFVIARLAPQDYHRWHYPLSGKVIKIEPIDGALYTVNPIAINKPVDVYTANKRCVVEIQGEKYSYIMFVIAATMVGSYRLHSKDSNNPDKYEPEELNVGDNIKRGDVAGEFRFGGSTILLLFETKCKIKYDDDIVRNVNSKFETLV
eukprot:990449_1